MSDLSEPVQNARKRFFCSSGRLCTRRHRACAHQALKRCSWGKRGSQPACVSWHRPPLESSCRKTLASTAFAQSQLTMAADQVKDEGMVHEETSCTVAGSILQGLAVWVWAVGPRV